MPAVRFVGGAADGWLAAIVSVEPKAANSQSHIASSDAENAGREHRLLHAAPFRYYADLAARPIRVLGYNHHENDRTSAWSARLEYRIARCRKLSLSG